MSQLGSYGLLNSPEAFHEGRRALRNTSDRANQHREHAIQGAISRLGIISNQGSQHAPSRARTPLSCQTPVAEPRAPRLARKPLSCQTPVAEPSDSDSNTSPSDEDSDDGYYTASSRLRSKRNLLKTQITTATPKRPASRSPSAGPATRRRKTLSYAEPDPDNSAEEEIDTGSRTRRQSNPRIITATPTRLATRSPSPPKRQLRPRRASRRL